MVCSTGTNRRQQRGCDLAASIAMQCAPSTAGAVVSCLGGLLWMDLPLQEGQARTAKRQSCPVERTGVHGAASWGR